MRARSGSAMNAAVGEPHRARLPSTSGVLFERVQAEIHFRDHAKSAEAAGHQLVDVVAGDILDHLAAALGDGAVGEHNRHADDEIAQAAIFQPQGAAVVAATMPPTVARSGHSGSSATICPCCRSCVLHRRPRAAGLHGAGHVLPGMLAQFANAHHAQLDVRRDRIPPAKFGSAAAGHHRQPVGIRESQHLGNLLHVGGSTRSTVVRHARSTCSAPTIAAR